MVSSRPVRAAVAVAALSAALPAVAHAQTLVVNGKPSGAQVKQIAGKSYVSLAELAAALGMKVVKRPDGRLELTKEGGAGQIANDNVGKMGQEVFTGKWRFQVTDIQKVDSYTTKYRNNQQTYEPKSGEVLYVVTCRIKNGTKVKDELVFSPTWEGMNTALTDAEERSFAPTTYDVRIDEGAPDGAYFLPGAAIPFVIVFSVPKDAQPKDLVFTALRYAIRTSYDQKKEAPTDIRVQLTP
jgi:hypothetical protein